MNKNKKGGRGGGGKWHSAWVTCVRRVRRWVCVCGWDWTGKSEKWEKEVKGWESRGLQKRKRRAKKEKVGEGGREERMMEREERERRREKELRGEKERERERERGER